MGTHKVLMAAFVICLLCLFLETTGASLFGPGFEFSQEDLMEFDRASDAWIRSPRVASTGGVSCVCESQKSRGNREAISTTLKAEAEPTATHESTAISVLASTEHTVLASTEPTVLASTEGASRIQSSANQLLSPLNLQSTSTLLSLLEAKTPPAVPDLYVVRGTGRFTPRCDALLLTLVRRNLVSRKNIQTLFPDRPIPSNVRQRLFSGAFIKFAASEGVARATIQAAVDRGYPVVPRWKSPNAPRRSSWTVYDPHILDLIKRGALNGRSVYQVTGGQHSLDGVRRHIRRYAFLEYATMNGVPPPKVFRAARETNRALASSKQVIPDSANQVLLELIRNDSVSRENTAREDLGFRDIKSLRCHLKTKRFREWAKGQGVEPESIDKAVAAGRDRRFGGEHSVVGSTDHMEEIVECM